MRTIRLCMLAVLLVASPFFVFSRGLLEKPVKLSGTVFPSPSLAPDFTLIDQQGVPFHMADTKGKVVVMSFIYTHCTDLCPFISIKLKSAIGLLGAEADKAVFVAVSTDPERDTQSVIAAYSKAASLYDSWHFLTGPFASVKDVWFKYGVGVDIRKSDDTAAPAAQGNAADTPEPTQGLTPAEADLARKIADKFGGGYDVSHTTPFWIIDKKGKIRAVMDADALPSEIAGDVRALING